MPDLRVGDRALLGHRVQTLGLSASDSLGRHFGVTALNLSTASEAGRLGAEVSSDKLIKFIPLNDPPASPASQWATIGPLCALERILDVTVQRIDPQFGRVPGLVTAFRGAVRMRTASGETLVRILVEVEFDPVESSTGGSTPSLVPADSGSLVTTWDGQVIGLLVGGSGHSGFVAPISCALESHMLVHTQFEPASGGQWNELRRRLIDAEAGIAALGAELAREPSLGMPDAIPELAL